ncbi:hypothetical protein JXL21_14880, partial [Candidatus Bathyarchaeota archaeon]|nr:hypothetical protein [Candidatus Bathyarchaeota archaeon]
MQVNDLVMIAMFVVLFALVLAAVLVGSKVKKRGGVDEQVTQQEAAPKPPAPVKVEVVAPIEEPQEVMPEESFMYEAPVHEETRIPAPEPLVIEQEPETSIPELEPLVFEQELDMSTPEPEPIFFEPEPETPVFEP